MFEFKRGALRHLTRLKAGLVTVECMSWHFNTLQNLIEHDVLHSAWYNSFEFWEIILIQDVLWQTLVAHGGNRR